MVSNNSADFRFVLVITWKIVGSKYDDIYEKLKKKDISFMCICGGNGWVSELSKE